jgi:hypothetical protein
MKFNLAEPGRRRSWGFCMWLALRRRQAEERRPSKNRKKPMREFYRSRSVCCATVATRPRPDDPIKCNVFLPVSMPFVVAATAVVVRDVARAPRASKPHPTLRAVGSGSTAGQSHSRTFGLNDLRRSRTSSRATALRQQLSDGRSQERCEMLGFVSNVSQLDAILAPTCPFSP